MFVAFELDISFISEAYKHLMVKNGFVAGASTLLAFILNGFLSPKSKAILVFWKTRNIYPGYKAFTELINKDCRNIDKFALMQMYGELPTKPDGQNTLWYKMFKKNEFHPMILDSHRSFLLSRDLTGLSFLLLVIYFTAALISRYIFYIEFNYLLPYIGFLLFQFLVLSIVSRNYGTNFACNVLALESSKDRTQGR